MMIATNTFIDENVVYNNYGVFTNTNRNQFIILYSYLFIVVDLTSVVWTQDTNKQHLVILVLRRRKSWSPVVLQHVGGGSLLISLGPCPHPLLH